MLSDEMTALIADLKTAVPGILKNKVQSKAEALLPHIEALERCQKLLDKYQWTYAGSDGYCRSCKHSIELGHSHDCAIAKALQESK